MRAICSDRYLTTQYRVGSDLNYFIILTITFTILVIIIHIHSWYVTTSRVLLSSRCTFFAKRMWNFGLFWPILTILLQIYAVFGLVLLTEKNVGGVPKLTNIRYDRLLYCLYCLLYLMIDCCIVYIVCYIWWLTLDLYVLIIRTCLSALLRNSTLCAIPLCLAFLWSKKVEEYETLI